jgi:hypothetical protein
MPKRELWEKIQRDDPDFAELLLAMRETFGELSLVEYVEWREE